MATRRALLRRSWVQSFCSCSTDLSPKSRHEQLLISSTEHEPLMINENPTPPASEPVPTATEAATKAWETTRQKAGEVMETGERYVRDHPGTSVLSIFGFGVALG